VKIKTSPDSPAETPVKIKTSPDRPAAAQLKIKTASGSSADANFQIPGSRQINNSILIAIGIKNL